MTKVDLFKDCPLDTVRRVSSFRGGREAQVAYFQDLAQREGSVSLDAVYRRVGEPMTVNLPFADMIGFSYGVIHDTMDIYFAVSDIQVVNEEKTLVAYEVDAWETLHYQQGTKLGSGTIERIRAIDEVLPVFGKRLSADPLRREYTYNPLFPSAIESNLGLLIYFRKSSDNTDGWYCFNIRSVKRKNDLIHGDMTALLADVGISDFAAVDIISVFVTPQPLYVYQPTAWAGQGNGAYALKRGEGDPAGIYQPWTMKYRTIPDRYLEPYDRMVVTDMRGSPVWEAPVGRPVPTEFQVWTDLGMNSASFKFQAKGLGDEGRFTVPFEPVSYFIDHYEEYFARQRDADMNARRLQADKGTWNDVVGIGSSVATGALMGAAAGPLGALAGGIGGLVGGGIQAVGGKMVSDHYMPKEQQIADDLHRAQRDELVMMGDALVAILAERTQASYVNITWDSYSTRRYKANIEVYGSIADTAVDDAQIELDSMVDDYVMSAGDMKIPVFRGDFEVLGPGPTTWKQQIHDRFFNGVIVALQLPPAPSGDDSGRPPGGRSP